MSAEPRYRPPLKWAGGKYRLLDRIKPRLPPGERLLEPFVGAGVMWLNTDYERFRLNDVNRDLIGLYKSCSRASTHFIRRAQRYFSGRYNNADAYYRLRDRFNQIRKDDELRAILFLYLNRHGYNGLCRYNSKGEFNVPFGRYKKPYFPEHELLHVAHQAKRATFTSTGFAAAMDKASQGDVVYCDPPYVPLSRTANFTSYSANGFGEREQRLLAEMAVKLANRNITVVISNHDTKLTRELYAGATVHSFAVRRFISRDGANRKHARELLAVFS